MNGKKVFAWALHIGLMVPALVFVLHAITDFAKGSAGYSEDHQPISFKDLPTLTVCMNTHYKLAYAKDMLIYASVFEMESETEVAPVELEENQEVQTGLGLTIHLGRLYPRYSQDQPKWPCFKLTPNWKISDRKDIDFEKLRMKLTFGFTNKSSVPSSADVMVTSEANSFGLAGGKWFDGLVIKNKLKFSALYGAINNKNEIKIIEVIEYKNMEFDCSKESYYQCLARRFMNLEDDKHHLHYKNGSKCSIKNSCAPFSLPRVDGRDIPICDLNISCSQEVLEKLESDQDMHCKRSCHAKEFKTEVYTANKAAKEDLEFDVTIRFELPESTLDLRSKKPFKTVKTEYLIVSWMSLVGNVGGTLGMFTGFSFITTSKWFAALVFKRLKCSKSKNHLKSFS